MSGDMELNLGPTNDQAEIEQILSKVDSTTFEGKDWNVVIMECRPLAANWEQLSGYIGLSFDLIDGIRGNHPNNNSDCWNEALKQWIKQNYETEEFGKPSWQSILKAVSLVDKQLFKKLAADHQVCIKESEDVKGSVADGTECRKGQAKSDKAERDDKNGGAQISGVSGCKRAAASIADSIPSKSPRYTFDSKKMNEGDTETASVQVAGLAVEKQLGGTFSDSARGRSSYTASTAGNLMTVFSEGIFGRQLGDFVGMGRGITLKDGDLNTGDDKLCHASLKGDLREVKRLTEEEQYDPLGVDENGINAFHYAVAAGHLDVLRYFTEDRGCNAACTGPNGWTPLHIAARFKQVDIVRYLLEKQQVEPFSRTNDGRTALHHACAGGSVDVIHYLAKEMSKYLPLKEVVEDQAHRGVRPLHVAAIDGHFEAVKFMLTELNSDPNATINVGANALHLAVFGGNLEVVKYLIEHHRQHCDPACRSTKDPEGWHSMARLLGLARLGGHHHIVEYLWSLNDL